MTGSVLLGDRFGDGSSDGGVNVPVPVNVTFSSFQIVVNPANSGMSGCKNGIARATASNFSFAAGVTNTKNITVTATST